MLERFPTLRDRIEDTPGATKEYVDADDLKQPHEVADPNTRVDETHDSLTDRIHEKPLRYTLLGFLGLLAVFIGYAYLGRYAITILANPWTQRVAAAVALLGVGYQAGRGSERSRLEETTELFLYDPEQREPQRYRCEFVDSAAAGAPVVKLIKGYRGWGHVPEPYRLRELSYELANAAESPDVPATVRLHPQWAGIAQTDTGTKIVQISAGIKEAPKARGSNLKVELPEAADENTLTQLRQQLAQAEQDIEDLRDQVHRQQERARKWQQEAKRGIDETRELIMEDFEQFARAIPGNGMGQPDEDNEREQGVPTENLDNGI